MQVFKFNPNNLPLIRGVATYSTPAPETVERGTCAYCLRQLKVVNRQLPRHGWTVQGSRSRGSAGNSWHTQGCEKGSPLELSDVMAAGALAAAERVYDAATREIARIQAGGPLGWHGSERGVWTLDVGTSKGIEVVSIVQAQSTDSWRPETETRWTLRVSPEYRPKCHNPSGYHATWTDAAKMRTDSRMYQPTVVPSYVELAKTAIVQEETRRESARQHAEQLQAIVAAEYQRHQARDPHRGAGALSGTEPTP